MPPLTNELPEPELMGALVASLPPDVLIRIFAAVPARERQGVLPLVCRRWHATATEPSRLFQRVAVDLTRPGTPLQPSLEQWLAARASFLHRLTIALSPETAASAAAAVRALAGASVAPQLCRLKIDFRGADAEAARQLLDALADAPRVAGKLERLGLVGLQGELRHAHLEYTLKLPCLHHFKLYFDAALQVSCTNWMPEGFPAFLLACSDLRELTIYRAGGAALRELPEGLSRLRRLRMLSLQADGVQALPAGLTTLSSLRTLKVVNAAAAVSGDTSALLSALHRLTDVRLRCRHVPAGLGSLRGLKRLALHFIRDNLEGEWAELLDRFRLKELSLTHCELRAVPAAVVSQASLRRLDLVACRLAELPPGPYLQRLTRLDLRKNLFTQVPQAALASPHLRALQMLDEADGEMLDVTQAASPAFAETLAAVNAKLCGQPDAQ